jgi:hypothetical protein
VDQFVSYIRSAGCGLARATGMARRGADVSLTLIALKKTGARYCLDLTF